MKKRFDEAFLAGEINADGYSNSDSNHNKKKESFDTAFLFGRADKYGNKTSRDTDYSLGKNIVTDEERENALRKARTALKNNSVAIEKNNDNESKTSNSKNTLTAYNYEQQKSELKQDKKDAWNSRVSTWFKKVGTQLNPDATDTEKAIAKSRYNSAKARHQTLADDYDTLKENEWNSTQEENAGIINSNSEVKSLVEQARNAKIKADAAKQNIDYYQPLSGNTSVANNLALQEQQKNYQAEYNTYSEIISKLDNLGYDGESLVDTYSRQKNLEEMEEFSGEVSDFASEHPVASSAAYVALNSAQSEALPDIIQGGLSALINDEYVPLDINSGSFGATNIRDTIAETNSENIENTVQEKTNSEFLANASSFLYQTGLSMGDSVSRAALPTPLASALAGASAAASTAKDATERGLSAENTLGTALSAGLNEAIGEGLSLGNLKAMKASGKGGIANTISDILKQAGVEGSEEVVTDILNTVSDQIINGDDSALSQQYQTYIDSGMTSQQAQKQVAIDYAKQVGQSFLGGAISGGVLGTGATALRNAQLNSAYRAEGRAIQDTGREGVAAVINEGLAQDSNSPAYKAASELLSRNDETDSYEIPETLSGRDLGKLGRLQQMNVRANDVSAFSEAVSGEVNSESLIKTFEKLTKGENINRKDANALMNNKTARTALSELTAIDEIGSGNVKNNRKLLGRVSDSYRDNTMQTFSAAMPLSNEQSRQIINHRLNTPIQQEEESGNQGTSPVIGRTVPNDSLNRSVTLNDGNEDTVRGIDRVENGIVYLNTANGNVIEAQNIAFADDTAAQLYKSAAPYDTETAKVYTFGFTDNGYSGSVYDYNTGFNTVYRAQKQGYSLDDAYNLARESSSITPMQAELAYYAAKNEDIQASKPVLPNSDETSSENIKPAETGAEIVTKINKTKQDEFNKALHAKKKPGVTVIAEKMSKSQKAEADLIGEYAKSIGREVIVVDDTEELGYGAANGMYQNGKIVLALNNTGGVMSVYFGHELFHDLKQTAPKQANELQEYVLDRLKSNADYNYDFRYAQLEDKYSDNLKGKTDAQKKSVIDEEIAANACFTVLSNENNFTALVKQNRSLAEKVRDFFADFVEKIKNALTRLAKNNAEYRALQNDTEAKEKILVMFNKALESSQNNSTAKNNSAKYALKEYSQHQIDNWKESKTIVVYENDEQAKIFCEKALEDNSFKKKLYFGAITEDMARKIKQKTRIDVSDLNCCIRADEIRKILKNSHGNEKKENLRGQRAITIDDILLIPYVIQNADTVRRSETDYEGKPVIEFVKEIDGKTTVISYVSRKHKDLTVQTIYAGVKDKKNRSLATTPSGDNSFSQTSKTLSGTTSTDTVSQNDTVVNNNNIQNEPKYSLKDPVEETKDLIAVHNISESNLLKSLDLGGFPMPSIAVMRARQADANADYGDISVVFRKDTIDPEVNRSNKVYGGDAWTPRFPTIEHEIDYDKASDIYTRAHELSKTKAAFKQPVLLHPDNIEDGINRWGFDKYLENLKDDYTIKQFYLLEHGEQPVEMQQREERAEVSEAYADLYDYLLDVIPDYHFVIPSKWNETYGATFDKAYTDYYRDNFGFTEEQAENVLKNMNTAQKKSMMRAAQNYKENGRVTVTVSNDTDATKMLIDSKIDQSDFENWVDDTFAGITKRQGIRNNVEPYTSSGNSRSFDALHYEVTLENLVRQMKTQGNGEGTFFSGLGIWGVAAKNYGTIEALKSDSFRLQNLSNEEYSEIKQGFGERLTEISNSLDSRYKSDNPFIEEDNKMTNIIDALRSSKTKSGVLRYLNEYFTNASESTVDDLLDLVADIGNMPTQYFEAKPQRAVFFNEVAYVVIPDNASEELKSKLNENGIRYEEYTAGDEQSRVDVLNSLDDVKFSMKEEDNTSVFEDNDELAESAEDVQNMLRLVSTENNELRKVFDIRTVRQAEDSSVAKVAAYLRKQYDSTYKKSDLVSNLAGLYNYITNAGENIDNEYVWRTAKSIAANVLANTQYKDTTLYEDYKQLRERIRTQNILISDSVKADMADYNDFRKRNFGRMRLSNDSGVALDTLYSELSAEYPEFFAPEAVLSEQLENIESFFIATAPVYYNGAEMMAESEGLSLDEYTNIVAADIFNQYFDVPEVKSYVSGSHQREMQELKTAYETEISDMRTLYQQRYEDQLVALRTENEQRLAEMKDKNDSALQKLKERNLETIAKQKAHFKDVSKRATQRRNASKLRESIRRNLKKIARLGANPDKKNHIPNEIVNTVNDLVNAINLSGTKKDQQLQLKLYKIKSAFEKAAEDTTGNGYAVYADAYNSLIANRLNSILDTVGDKTINELNIEELTNLDQIFKITLKTISNLNKLFIDNKNQTALEYSRSVVKELNERKDKDKTLRLDVNGFFYNSLKPEYFFDYIGSDTLKSLYKNISDGENEWAKFISDAKNKLIAIRDQYKWQDWDLDKRNITIKNGDEKLDFSLSEILGLYANTKRQQNMKHLSASGFTYQTKIDAKLKKENAKKITKAVNHLLYGRNDPDNHNISDETLIKLIGYLSPEQKSYVDDILNYISTDLSKKGNEVSKKLYGVELFTEKTYYPIVTAELYRKMKSTETVGPKQIVNSGMTKQTNPNAQNPLVLMPFDDLIAKHINDMAKYVSFVLPLEDFSKVYDYNFTDAAVKPVIQRKFSSSAIKYIDKLLSDINGDVVKASDDTIGSKLVSKFKKGAVFASASVAIQQPSAIARALSEVDTKYFAKTSFREFNKRLGLNKTAFEEMKKYAPVAIIKEMGYFDTNMAQTTIDYLNNKTYRGIKEKWNAFWKDGSYRDDVLSFFASRMDELTWTHIWNAVKAETKAHNPELSDNSEQLLKKAGERFTEVIRKTQVYDSVFSRSGLMRSKSELTKMATSFMSEPTTSLNMLANAVVQVKRGKMSKKQGARVLGSLVAASAFNALLQSIVTAARDDDEEPKEWGELYLAQLIPNFIDNLNPLNQIVYIRDVINIFKGYDIERADMSLFSDLYDAFTKLSSDNASTKDKITTLAGAISAFFGFPLKNITRDIEAAFNLLKDAADEEHFSSEDAIREFKDEMNSYLGFELFKTDLESAIKGVQDGDMETYEKYADDIYAGDDAYDLLYEVLKKYGADSSTYKEEKERVIDIKKENGSKKPIPDSAMKDRAIKDYAKERYRPKEDGGDYNKSEPYRQICMALYGSMTDVEEALKNYAITQYMKIRNDGTSEEVEEAEQLCLNVYGSERAFQAAIRKFEEDDDD